MLVADEPDEARPDDWLIHAYFEHSPTADEDRRGGRARPRPTPARAAWRSRLGDDEPGGASADPRRPLHRPHARPARPIPSRINFEIDASLAFGTGQHATTSGCLAALDRLESGGKRFANIADIGTGTGLLAFAALALWPEARCIATDIDPVAIDVARDNAAINHVTLGHGAGELLLGVADGMDSPLLTARAPFDLIVANILAGPLIELAPDFVRSLAPGGTVVLAGLLDTQADGVIAAYEALGLTLTDRGFGEWPVLVCERPV